MRFTWIRLEENTAFQLYILNKDKHFFLPQLTQNIGAIIVLYYVTGFLSLSAFAFCFINCISSQWPLSWQKFEQFLLNHQLEKCSVFQLVCSLVMCWSVHMNRAKLPHTARTQRKQDKAGNILQHHIEPHKTFSSS